MIVFSSQILLNLLYLLQVNFWEQVNYVFSLISLIASSYCLACPFIFSPHFGLISFLHSLIFSEFSYIPLLFSSLLPSLYSFFPLSLTFFSIKNRCLQYSHFSDYSSIFEISKNAEKILNSSRIRESQGISQEVDLIKTFWDFPDWQIYYILFCFG